MERKLLHNTVARHNRRERVDEQRWFRPKGWQHRPRPHVQILALAVCLLSTTTCVYGPEIFPVTRVDTPPYLEVLEPETVEVSFNLSDDPQQRFLVNRVLDFDDDDGLQIRAQFSVTIGDNPPSEFDAGALEIIGIRQDETGVVYRLPLESAFVFEPCQNQEVLSGAQRGEVTLTVTDPIPPELQRSPDETEWNVSFTWRLDFQGECRLIQ